MAGVKGRSGRKKTLGTLMDAAMGRIDQNLEFIFQQLIDKAMAGDKEAAIYLIDRRMGRPHQSIDQRIKGEINITADQIVAAIDGARREQIEFLEPTLLEGECTQL